jgi:putative ABC transport system permease protein
VNVLPLVLRQARAVRGPLALFGALVLVTAYLAAAAPAALDRVYNSAIHDLLNRTPALVKDIQVTGRPAPTVGLDGSAGRSGPKDLATVEETRRVLRALLPAEVSGEIGSATYIVRTLQRDPASGRIIDSVSQSPSAVPNLQLATQVRNDFAGHVRYTSGGPPGPAGSFVLRSENEAPRTLPRFDIVISTKTADSIQLAVGDIAIISADEPVAAFRISGTFEPADPNSSYWSLDRSPLAASVQPRDADQPPDVFATGITAPEGYSAWLAAFGDHIDYLWRFEPDPDKLAAGDAPGAARGLNQYASLVAAKKIADMPLQLNSGLAALLDGFSRQLRTAQAVMGVALAGLLAVALLVVLLAAQLVAERRRAALGLLRARGCSLGQLIGLVVAEAALAAVPAAIVGYIAAVLTVSVSSSIPLWLAVSVAGAAVGLSAAVAAAQHRRVGRLERRDLIRARPPKPRLVFEGLVILLAAVGVVLLHRRGLTTEVADRGGDPFLLAVPVLLGLAVGLAALRAYPYPLRLLSGAVGRWRSTVPFLGVARSSREALTSTLPLVAVLLGLGLGLFGTLFDQGMARAQGDRAWREVGADVQVRRDGIEASQIEQIRQLDGVAGVVPAVVEDDAVLHGDHDEPVVAIAINLSAYRSLVSGSPLAQPGGHQTVAADGNTLHALVSPTLEAMTTSRSSQLDWNTLGIRDDVAVDGTIDAFPTMENAPALTIVPYQAFVERYRAVLTNTLFVAGSGIDLRQIKMILGSDAFVAGRTQRFEEIRDAPLATGVRTVFAVGVAALGVYCGLAILFALVIGADTRANAIAYLRTLGLSRRQSRGLALLEVGPLVVAAMLGGLVLGLILPHVVGPAVDLRAYTGGEKVSTYPLDPAALGVLFGGTAALASLAILVDAALSRRRRPSDALRVGD